MESNMKGMGIVIHHDDCDMPFDIITDTSLKSLQKVVGGYIECIPHTHEFPKMEALVNEEGLIHNLPPNILASRLLNYPVVGNCILVLAQELMGDEPEESDRPSDSVIQSAINSLEEGEEVDMDEETVKEEEEEPMGLMARRA